MSARLDPAQFHCAVAEPLSVEARFGVRNCRPREGDSHCDVEIGEWASDVDGTAQLGVLGIVADHALGELALIRSPAGTWPVTAELTVEFVAPIEPRANLHVWATPTHMEEGGGFANGGMLDVHGGVVALCSTRTLFVPSKPTAPVAERPVSIVADSCSTASNLDDHLRLEEYEGDDDGTVSVRMAEPGLWQNDFGILHGGIWLCLAEVAASRAISRRRPGLTTASIHTTYLRPGASVEPVTVTARVQHAGSRLALVECTGRSKDGAVCTVSTVTARRAAGRPRS